VTSRLEALRLGLNDSWHAPLPSPFQRNASIQEGAKTPDLQTIAYTLALENVIPGYAPCYDLLLRIRARFLEFDPPVNPETPPPDIDVPGFWPK
jgi:hypothetical protein